MSAPETSKRESNKESSFLGTVNGQDTILTYLFDQQESTTLASVFTELFKRVEDNYLTNSENISDNL